METQEAGSYIAGAEQIDTTNPDMRELPEEQVVALENRKRFAGVLKQAENESGVTVDHVVTGGGDPGVAGFYIPGSDEINISQDILGNHLSNVKHVLTHEQGHRETLKKLPPKTVKLLNEMLGDDADLDMVQWIEGFNEYRTIQKTEVDDTVAYKEEVEAARRIERLCQDLLGVSMFDVFIEGMGPFFDQRVEELHRKQREEKVMAVIQAFLKNTLPSGTGEVTVEWAPANDNHEREVIMKVAA